MKYKLEVWKYGVFDCIDGGDHLNKMLKKGWQYYGRIGDIAIYKKQKGDLNIKYCIDVFFTNDEKEAEEYETMFKDAGWSLYSCHDKSGQRIFTGIDKNDVVCPYTDEDSRIEHMISHGIGNEYVDKKIGFSFLKIVGLLFLIKIFNIMSFRILFGIMIAAYGCTLIGLISNVQYIKKASKQIASGKRYKRGRLGVAVSQFCESVVPRLKILAIIGLYLSYSIIMMRFIIRGDFTTINLILIWASFFVNLIGIPVSYWLYVDGFVRGKPKEMSLSNTILVLISLSFCIANFII